MARIEIDGQRLQLERGEVVAVTLQADSLESASTVQSSYSSEFRIPLTQTNRNILGSIGALDGNGAEYAGTACTLYSEDDTPLNTSGQLLIDRVEGQSLRVNVLEGASSIFEELGNATLQMLGVGAIGTPVERTGANVRANMDNDYTSGFTYATLDYGDNPGTAYDSTYMWPCSYVHAVFQAIFSNLTTYTLDTSVGLMQDTFFRKVALPYAGTRYNEEEQFVGDLTGYTITAGTAGPGVYVNVTPQTFKVANANFDDFGYEVQDSRRAMFFESTADITITTDSGNYEYNIRIRNITQGTTYASFSSGAQTGQPASVNVSYTLQSGLTDSFEDGDHIRLEIDAVTGLLFDFTAGEFRNDDAREYGGTNLYQNPPAGFALDSLALMPDMLCVDFVKAVCNMFMARLEVDTVSKTVALPMFKDYSQDTANADTWSAKVDALRPLEIEYKYGNWGQVNLFTYEQEEVPEGYGNGQFSIGNTQLPDTPATIIALPFASSFYTNYGQLSVPILTGSPLDLGEPLAPRICYLESATGSITVDSVAVSDYMESFFRSLAWGSTTGTTTPASTGLLAMYWSELQAVVGSMEKVTIYLKLDAADFAQLDFFTPKYVSYTNNLLQLSGYYFLQKVKEWRGTGTVECELINLNIS